MTEIVALGQACIDYLGRIHSLPVFEADIMHLAGFSTAPGGMAATAAVTSQRLGVPTALIAFLGDDHPGRAVIESLQQEGVETDLVRVLPGVSTRVAIILVDAKDGRRVIMPSPEPVATAELTEADRQRIAGARVLHLDAFPLPTAIEAARWARENDVAVTIDVNRIRPGMKDLIGLVDYLVTNSRFPHLFTGQEDLELAARALLDMGPRVVVVTQGEQGSRTWTRERSFPCPAYRVEVVDTTGAGDVFHGAYCVGVARGWDLEYTAAFASAAAALKCRRMGGQEGIPRLEELRSFLAAQGIANP